MCFCQPLVEREIVRQAAKQTHSSVGVAVYQAGQDKRAASVERGCADALRFQFGSFADGEYCVAADG